MPQRDCHRSMAHFSAFMFQPPAFCRLILLLPVHAHTHTPARTHRHIQACIHEHVHMHTHKHMHMHTYAVPLPHMRSFTFAPANILSQRPCIHTCRHVHTYIRMYTCTCAPSCTPTPCPFFRGPPFLCHSFALILTCLHFLYSPIPLHKDTCRCFGAYVSLFVFASFLSFLQFVFWRSLFL